MGYNPLMAHTYTSLLVHCVRAGFDAEFLALLKKHGIAFEERYVFG